MTIAKRIGLSLACVFLAFAIFVIPGSFLELIRPHQALETAGLLLVYLLFTLPGWVLSLPLVIYFENAEGWRTWAILILGTTIGPCFILGWTLMVSRTINWQGDGFAVFMALVIGFLTTLIYVLALRHFTRKTYQEASLSILNLD